jgi:hypothetical protein
MSLNLSKIIADALQGRPTAPRDCTDNGSTPIPPEEFLAKDVWPLLQQARQGLEDKGFLAATITPVDEDESRTHALLFMDWSAGLNDQDAGCLRFMITDGALCAAVKHPWGDSRTIRLEPQGNIVPVMNVIEEFLHHCLAPVGLRRGLMQRSSVRRHTIALRRTA